MSRSLYQRVLGQLLLAIGAGSLAASCEEEPSTEHCDIEPSRFCLSQEAMETIARDGYGYTAREQPRTDAEVAAAFDAHGCLRHDWVSSSCCNPALGPGRREGELCCYTTCEQSCCGRALVIAGHAQVSGAEPRSDWL